MALKKTDKIIAIIGVLILIIAGIGIFLYVGTEETTPSAPPIEEKIYNVKWAENTGTMSISGFAGKRATYIDPINLTESQGSVITDVTVYFVWKDDRHIGFILTRGWDTLTADITPPVGEAQTHQSKGGSDNTTGLTFDKLNSAPEDYEITDASSIEDATQRVMDEYANKNTASFETKITVKVGEPLRRPWKYFRDKGNGFTIEITYTYYTPIIEEGTSPPPIPPEESGYNGSPYHGTSLPGRQ